MMFTHNFRSPDTSSSEIVVQALSIKRARDSFAKRLLLARKLLFLRVVIVVLMMVLVMAVGLLRQPARAAVSSARLQALSPAVSPDGPPFGLKLDFDEGSHKAGEVIPLARIFREDGTPAAVSDADMCKSLHLHGTIKIKDCKTGILEGPFQDPFAIDPKNECGHGKVEPFRADVTFLDDKGNDTLQGPPIAEVGGTLTYTFTVKNNGPDTAELVGIQPTLQFDGAPVLIFFDAKIEGCDDALGNTCEFFPLLAGASKTVRYSLKITDNQFLKKGTLAVTFKAVAFSTCDILFTDIDPKPENNVDTQGTTIVDGIGAGVLNGILKEFELGHIGDPAVVLRPPAGVWFVPIPVGEDTLKKLLRVTGDSAPHLLLPDSSGFGFTPGQSLDLPKNFIPIRIGIDGNLPAVNVLGADGGIDSFPVQTDGTFGPPTVTPGDNNKAVDFSTLPVASNPFIARVSSIAAAAQADGFAAAAQTGILSVLKGDKTGAFQTLSTIPLPGVPSAIVTGDFNGDKKADVAVTLLGAAEGSPGSVLLFLGDGAGNFTAAGTLTAGVKPSAIAVGDFNNDNNLDLAVANNDSNDVTIFLGNGSGGFSLATTVPVGTNPVAIVAGDFNNNGKLDLATANEGSNDVTILLGGGNGLFVPTNVAAGTKPSSLVAADFNGDGKLDLAVANSGSGDVLILGNGATPVTRAVVTAADVSGKRLTVTGSGFDNGTLILLNGVEQSTANDSQSPTTALVAKKGGKKIKPGQSALIQVKSSAGIFSEGLIFTRSSQ